MGLCIHVKCHVVGKIWWILLTLTLPCCQTKAFHLSTKLDLYHSEPSLEDQEHSIFSSGRVCPHFPGWIVDEAGEVGGTTKGLMWHRSTNVRMDSILLVMLSGVRLRPICCIDNACRTSDLRWRVWECWESNSTSLVWEDTLEYSSVWTPHLLV